MIRRMVGGSVFLTVILAANAFGQTPAKLPKPEEPAQPAEAEGKSDAAKPAPLKLKNMDAAPAGGASALTDQHKLYEPLVGTWKVVVTLHGFGEDAQRAAKSVITFQSILDGRFLQENAEITLMGDLFKYIGIYGYDRKSGKFTAMWADNGSDSHDVATGTYDETTHTFTFTGEQDDPRTGGRTPFKWTIRLHPPDGLTIEFFEPGPDGKEQLVMRMAGGKQ